MKSEGYLRRSAEWAVRARRDQVRWATSLEGVCGTHFGEGNSLGIGEMGATGYILGGGTILGSGTTLGVDSGGWP